VSDDLMQVELVAADRLVWSGEAKMVIARTTEGDVGILPNHAPVLSLMVHGIVDVTTSDDETWVAAVDAGFLSVANNRISRCPTTSTSSAPAWTSSGASPRVPTIKRRCRRPRLPGPRRGSAPRKGRPDQERTRR
jgi:hypothetical protein